MPAWISISTKYLQETFYRETGRDFFSPWFSRKSFFSINKSRGEKEEQVQNFVVLREV